SRADRRRRARAAEPPRGNHLRSGFGPVSATSYGTTRGPGEQSPGPSSFLVLESCAVRSAIKTALNCVVPPACRAMAEWAPRRIRRLPLRQLWFQAPGLRPLELVPRAEWSAF